MTSNTDAGKVKAGELKGTALYRKTLGCLVAGLIGDAMGTPTEGKNYRDIIEKYGWLEDFTSDGTDDTIMKNLLAEALVRTGGYATADDWARVWLDHWGSIFGQKVGKFFQSVIHTAAKLRQHSIPRCAALGNMPSSSSAMCISPVGIVNAGNPRQAALQTYSIAALIHVHDVGFCQDGAAAMAAAVAEAFCPTATVDSIIDASIRYLMPESGKEMLGLIDRMLTLAKKTGSFEAFRTALYEENADFFCRITCDSRETVPLTLALFLLAGGDTEKCITYGANLGRDADTIASMCGAIGGALNGVDSIRKEWLEKVKQYTKEDQEAFAESLARVAISKYESEKKAQEVFAGIAR